MKVANMIVSALLATTLGFGLFVEIARYTACHAQVENLGLTPNYDPVTMKCTVRL